MTMVSPPQISCSALFLADHASVESGKLYVNGGYWNRLQFPSFPTYYTFSVAAVLLVPWHDHKQHEFSIHFTTADGKRVGGELSGNFSAGTLPGAKEGDPSVFPIAATIGNFLLERSGDYEVVIEVDGQALDRWSFGVSQQLSAFGHVAPVDASSIPPAK
ncbi:DUF6941 family protein [Leifsonia sp. McL0607]|uniref:DUF6941 family protein n=1 Tax=Leifsonia sp. McL0607 TaxID=3415672 RepID=UPI003CEB398F